MERHHLYGCRALSRGGERVSTMWRTVRNGRDDRPAWLTPVLIVLAVAAALTWVVVRFGRPVQPDLSFAPQGCEEQVMAWVAETRDGRVVIVNSALRNEPITSMAALLTHEVLHQDSVNGQPEEIIAHAIETVNYGQLLLMLPEADAQNEVRSGGCATRWRNTMLLMMLNSGRKADGFYMGILESPRADALPGSRYRVRSFADGIRRLYPGLPDQSTPGNTLLQAAIETITGETLPAADFSQETIEFLDANFRPFTADEVFRLARLLLLEVDEPGSESSPLSPSIDGQH